MQFSNLFTLLVKIAIMAALGYALRRTGFIDDAFKQKLSALLLGVVMPLGLIATGNSTFDPAVLGGLLQSTVVVVAYYVLTLLLMKLLTKPMGLSPPDKGLLSALVVFANTSFIGYPISQALFGGEGLLYAVVYNLGWQLFVSLFGERLLNPAGRASLKKLIRNPLLLAAILSVSIFVSPWRLPGAVVETFADIGAMAVPLSMFIVGCSVAEIKFSSIFTLPGAYLVSFLRLCALPLLMLAILWALGMRGAVPGTMVLITALPAGSMNVVFAEKYGANVKFAATAVVQSTLFMVVSVPLLMLLVGKVL